MKVLRSLCITFVICFRTKLCYSGIAECPKYPGCRRNSDCTEVTCDDKFLNQDVHSVMKLNLCKFPLSLTVKISVQGSTWSHTFTSLEDVPMAKFQNNVGVVQVRGQLTENQKKPKKAFIKLQLRAIPLVMKSSGDFQNVTIAEETIGGIERGISDCGVIEWYRDQESIYQALIIAGLVVGGLIFLTGCCFCCCCCRPCRSRRIKTTVVVHKDDEMPFRNIEGSYKLNTPASLQ